jgi:hypothetical protein
MFGRILCGGAAILVCASIVCADDKADIQAATQKLADAPSYSYTTTTVVPDGQFGAGTNQGKIDKAGYTWLSIEGFQGNMTEVLIKGDQTAVKPSDGAWQTMQEFTAAGDNGGGFNPSRFLAMQIDTAKDPVARDLEMIGALQNLQKTDDGYTADLSDEAAKELLSFRRRAATQPDAQADPNAPPPPEITNPKATIKIWVTDGMLSKVELHTTGSVSFNGNSIDVDRTATTEFKDVGSTKVDVPDDAKAKLGS